jgi:hypothetical protein
LSQIRSMVTPSGSSSACGGRMRGPHRWFWGDIGQSRGPWQAAGHGG